MGVMDNQVPETLFVRRSSVNRNVRRTADLGLGESLGFGPVVDPGCLGLSREAWSALTTERGRIALIARHEWPKVTRS